MPRVKLELKGFKPLEGDAKRRAVNPRTGEVISRREFVKRAKRIEPEQQKVTPKKPRETVKQRRARWYANHVNRQVWLEEGNTDEYISFDQAINSPEFQYYDSLIHSRYEEDRALGYDYFDELEQEFMSQDWGETP